MHHGEENDPTSGPERLRARALELETQVPTPADSPRTDDDRLLLEKAAALRAKADRLEEKQQAIFAANERELRLMAADMRTAQREGISVHHYYGTPAWLPEEVPDAALHFPPAANALDYLVSVVDHLTPDELGNPPGPRDRKYAVLHLDAAVETALKARLELHDWQLVCKEPPGTVTRQDFEAGRFRSCDAKEAGKRLRRLNVPYPDGFSAAITRLGELRNRLQHFGASSPRADVEAVIAPVLDLLAVFLDDVLRPALGEPDRATAHRHMLHIRAGLNRIDCYTAERLKRLAPELAGVKDRTVECPRCHQNTLVVGVTVGCRFCRSNWPPEELAVEYCDIIQPVRGAGPHGSCADCGRSDSVVRHVTRIADLRNDSPFHDSVTFCFACAAAVADESPVPAPRTQPAIATATEATENKRGNV